MKRKLLTMSALALVCGVSAFVVVILLLMLILMTLILIFLQENTSSQNDVNNNNTNAKIISNKAKEIALNHANLSENQVTFIKSNIDYDDGIKVSIL